jgi:Domain of unknown function (DUF1877)
MSRQHYYYQVSQSLCQMLEDYGGKVFELFLISDSDSFEEFQEYIEKSETEIGDLSLNKIRAIYEEAQYIICSEERCLEIQGRYCDSMHHLLSGNRFEISDFLVVEGNGLTRINALCGQHKISDTISSDGAFYLSPSEVKILAAALSNISEDDFEKRVQFFNEYISEGYSYLLEVLIPFYKLASNEESGILISISA